MAKKSKKKYNNNKNAIKDNIKNLLDVIYNRANTIVYNDYSYHISNKDDFKTFWHEVQNDDEFLCTLDNIRSNSKLYLDESSDIFKKRRTSLKNQNIEHDQNSMSFRDFILSD